MNKRSRQYVGLLSAILAYYFIHEGAHFAYALATGVFKQINFMGLGVQIDVYSDKMSESQLGVFCLLGSVATLAVAFLLVAFAKKICRAESKPFKACMYYITIAMLLIDPIYLSILSGFFGGGDMNGISLLVPEVFARSVYGCMLIVNIILFFKIVLPRYKKAFEIETKVLYFKGKKTELGR